MELNLTVTTLKNIGPKYKRLLENLEICTIEDLLYHFPFRYDDFSQIKKIKNIQEHDNVTIQGVLDKVSNIYTRNGKRITTTKIVDETGDLNVIWFNSHYLKKTLKMNENYNLSGKVSAFNNKLTLVAPTFEIVGHNNLNTGRLVPVYPETAGIYSKWLRSRINDVLNANPIIEEFLPNEILIKEKLPELKTALKNFHFPNSMDDMKKARFRFQLEELFIELLNVELKKKEWSQKSKSFNLKYLTYKEKIEDFVASLPFKLTHSQENAITDIVVDLKEPHPMNRILEGDVGTGKTIVAIITAYLVHLNGFKTLYMAPTEILAKQHFETFKKFLENRDVSISLQTSNTKKCTSDITIGTHALLYRDIPEKVAFVVIDEQHRFGVEQRTKLLNRKITPHLLAMTATPIPRTLALTLYGDLKISILDTPPNKDKKITTKVVTEKHQDKIFEWVKEKNEQTFVVCPFIEESKHKNLEDVKSVIAEFERLKDGIFQGCNLGLLHGKMSSDEKHNIIRQFEMGEIQILVSTPVIEVGIDVPEATIMVIESAERYGLASLHQLRGRVGRRQKEGFCFAITSGNNKNSYTRLKYLESIDNGLELAEIDMKIRGHGNIYGTMQHGFQRFKVATIDDTETLEKAKTYAQQYVSKLEELPNLKTKINDRKGKFIGNN